MLPVPYKGRLISTIQNFSLKLVICRLPLCLDPALMSAAPRYGLRYGSVPATGNFQRLRGRPPLKSFKVVYGPFFHGGDPLESNDAVILDKG